MEDRSSLRDRIYYKLHDRRPHPGHWSKILLDDADDENHESYNLENLLFTVQSLTDDSFCSAKFVSVLNSLLEEDMTITSASEETEY